MMNNKGSIALITILATALLGGLAFLARGGVQQPTNEPTLGKFNDPFIEVQGGTGTSTYVTGDLLYADGANTLGSLPVGSAGQVLKVSGGVPSWGTDAGGSGASSWEVAGTNLITPTNTLAGIIVRGSSTIDSNLRVSGSLNSTSTVTDNLKVLSTCIGCNNTSTPDYIISKVGNTVFSTETRTGNVISSNNSADVVLGATLGHATTTRLMNGADIFVKDGEYFLNATTTFYGTGTDQSNTWKLHGAGQDKTRFVVNNDSTAFHLTKYAKVDFRNFTIFLSDGETGITSRSHDGWRSVWNSNFDSLNFIATSTNPGFYGTAVLMGNDFRNTWNNIQFIKISNCIKSYAEPTGFFNNGDSVYQNIMCSSDDTLSNTVAYDFVGGGSQVTNQNVFNMVNAYANRGSKTAWRLNQSERFIANGLGVEGFATTTELYNSDNNTFKYFYIIGSTTPSVYFKADSLSQDNVFNNSYVDTYTGTHYLLKDSNITNSRPNIIQGIDGTGFGTYGSGSIKNASTSASIIRDWNKNGNSYLDQVKITGEKLLLNAASGGSQYLSGSATSTLSNGITIDTSTLVVNSNENKVGILIANPQAALDVNGTANFAFNVFMNQSNGGYWLNNNNAFTHGIHKFSGGQIGIRAGSASVESVIFDTASTTITTNLSVEGNASTTGYQIIGTTHPTINLQAGDLWGGRATTTNIAVTSLATCDVKTDGNGSFYCGTDATIAGQNGALETVWSNTLAPTNTSAGIFVYASSTFNSNLRVNGNATTSLTIAGIQDGTAMTLGSGANTSVWLTMASARSVVGYDGGNAVLQGGSGKGLELNVNNNTFGAGTALSINTAGNTLISGNATTSGFLVVGTTNPTINMQAGDVLAGRATTTNLAVSSLNAASCDVMADTNGSFYCGTNGAGSSGANGMWETFALNVIRPTNTSAAILVNAASSTITQLVSNNATISTLNSTSTNIGTLVVYTGSTFPNNDITDAEVSDTLTASDLQAASAVVADSEVIDALTINTSIEAIYTGNIRSNHINATSTNVGTLTGYGLATLPDLRASMLNSSTTNVGTINVFTQSSLAKATATNFAVTTLTAANCDVKASTIGDFYCGTDATAAGAPAGFNGAWEAFSANVLRPTNTTAAILINSASSTITRFNSNGATISDINATTTQVGTLMVYGGATSTNLAVLGMTAANCDVKATTAGTFYCGIDAGGAGSDMNSWESFGTNVLRPTNTAASILVNVATSTITNLTMNNATSTGNFVVGTSVWQAPTSSLSILGGLHVFNSVATSSEAVWIGSGGVANGINLQGGDLYVQGDVEIDGVLGTTGSRVSEAYFDTVDTNNITIGGDTISEFAGSGLTVSGNALTVTGKAPAGFNGAWETLAANILRPTNTTAAIIVNSATSTITNLKMNNSTTTDFGIFGTSALAAPTNTVSIIGNSFIQGRSTSTATSTVGGFRVTDDEGAVQHGVEIIPGATTTLRFY